jgi:hypothetical protein
MNVMLFNFDTMQWEQAEVEEATAALELVAGADAVAGSQMSGADLLAVLLGIDE